MIFYFLIMCIILTKVYDLFLLFNSLIHNPADMFDYCIFAVTASIAIVS